MIVKSGLETLREKGYKPLHGQRIGLMTNPSAVDRKLQSTYHILCYEPSLNVVALFGAEHGFAGSAPDGQKIESSVDPGTGLPVYSLYGASYRPTPEMLKDLDVIVCDVQDIGVRYYTFVWTISHILEAAGEHGVSVVVLDRPNPMGGIIADGPLLEAGISSFVGRFPIPVCHGLTIGELIWMINETWNPHLARLSVISCYGWQREMKWADTRLHWVPPSPNMPHLGTLQQYPGACLVEGTNLSEGRGTPLPFEIVGAPWIDGVKLAEHLNSQPTFEKMGACFRPHTFQPTASKYAAEYCGGVQVHVSDSSIWRPLEVWLGVIAAVRALYPDQFAWLLPPQPDGVCHFDRLIGSTRVRQNIDAGNSIAELTAGWAEDARVFTEQRKPFQLYE